VNGFDGWKNRGKVYKTRSKAFVMRLHHNILMAKRMKELAAVVVVQEYHSAAFAYFRIARAALKNIAQIPA